MYVGIRYSKEDKIVDVRPSRETTPFKIAKFKKDPSNLNIEQIPEWIKKYGSVDFKVISDDSNQLKISVNLNSDIAKLNGGAIVEELIQADDGKYYKTGRILAKYENSAIYGNYGENGYREFILNKEEYKDVNYKFQLSIVGGYDNKGSMLYVPIFDFKTSTKAKSTNPAFLTLEETASWIKQHGSAKFKFISEGVEKVKFSIDLNTNRAVLKAGAIIEELKQDENGDYKKTGRTLGYYNLWNNYGRDGLNENREFTIYKDEISKNYKFQLSIGSGYDSNANVVYTPTFEFDTTIKSK